MGDWHRWIRQARPKETIDRVRVYGWVGLTGRMQLHQAEGNLQAAVRMSARRLDTGVLLFSGHLVCNSSAGSWLCEASAIIVTRGTYTHNQGRAVEQKERVR